MTTNTSTTGAAASDAPASDPYALLGLPADPDLTDDDVQQAWRARIRRVHPDHGGSSADAPAATAAYQVLRPAVRRGEILNQLEPSSSTPSATARPTEAVRLARADGGLVGERAVADHH